MDTILLLTKLIGNLSVEQYRLERLASEGDSNAKVQVEAYQIRIKSISNTIKELQGRGEYVMKHELHKINQKVLNKV